MHCQLAQTHCTPKYFFTNSYIYIYICISIYVTAFWEWGSPIFLDVRIPHSTVKFECAQTKFSSNPLFTNPCMYIYMQIYIYACIYIYVHIFVTAFWEWGFPRHLQSRRPRLLSWLRRIHRCVGITYTHLCVKINTLHDVYLHILYEYTYAREDQGWWVGYGGCTGAYIYIFTHFCVYCVYIDTCMHNIDVHLFNGYIFAQEESKGGTMATEDTQVHMYKYGRMCGCVMCMNILCIRGGHIHMHLNISGGYAGIYVYERWWECFVCVCVQKHIIYKRRP